MGLFDKLRSAVSSDASAGEQPALTEVTADKHAEPTEFVRQAADRIDEQADRVEEHADRMEEQADRAEAEADRAESAATSSVQVAQQIDDSTDLLSETPAPAPVPARQETPSLLRHTPFVVGFFGAIGAAAGIFLLQQLLSISGIITLLVISMFLAIGLNPLVEWFMKRGLKRGLAVGLVLVLVLGVLALFVMTVAPVISEQIALISKNAPSWLDQLQHNRRVEKLDAEYDVIDRVEEYIANGDFGQKAFGGVLGVGLKVLSVLTNALIVIVLMVYFLASLPSIKHSAYSLAPASKRPRVAELGDRIIRSTGAYVSGAFLVAICAGIGTLIFTFIIGLGEYSFALAFIVGLLSLIPVVGAVVSAVIMTALGLTVSPTTAIICLVYYLAYQQFEQYVIYPKIMSRTVDLPGTITVVAALLGGSLLGITGALLAVPVAAALVLLHKEVFLKRQDAR